MTITDLINEFRISYDLGGIGLPGFEDDEILSFLEIAQYKAISQKFGGNNVYGSKFPDTKKRIDDLHRIMAVSTITMLNTTSIFKMVILPDDYLHLASVTLQYPDGTDEEARQIDYSQLARFQNSKRNSQAYIKNPVYVFDKETEYEAIRVYFDSSYETNPTSRLLYITKPSINMNDESNDLDAELVDFNDDVYHEIVAMAKDQAIEVATPSKSQVSQQHLNKIE